jgi:uncharacterized membrane protein (UPF0182 family)
LAIAGCHQERYGKIYLYSFPKGEQVYGPDQISALIDQDTTIAEQFTLWDQAGSEVTRGRMLILPVGKAVFYIQPVYLSAASRLKIPQLQRLIVSHGEVVVMDRSLEDAFEQVARRMEQRQRIQQERALPPPQEQALVPAGPADQPEAGNQPRQTEPDESN